MYMYAYIRLGLIYTLCFFHVGIYNRKIKHISSTGPASPEECSAMVATRLLDPWTFQHGVSIGWWLGASDTTMAIIIQKNKKNPCSSKSFEKSDAFIFKCATCGAQLTIVTSSGCFV